MNLNTLCVILLLVRSVKLDGCHEFVDENNKQVDFEKECNQNSKPCVVKCCRPDEALRLKKPMFCEGKEEIATKVKLTDDIQTELKTYSGLIITSENGTSSRTLLSNFRILYRRHSFNTTECEAKLGITTDYANIKEDGNLAYYDWNTTVATSNYCYDIVVTPTPGLIYMYHLAFDDTTEIRQTTMFVIYCTPISVLFLFLTLVVYGMEKNLHGNLIGVMTMVFMSSLICVVLINAFINIRKILADDEGSELEPTDCKWLIPILYFLTLSTFFWMNAMCFDTWRAIRSPTVRNGDRQRFMKLIYSKKFVYYALYAWGTSAVLTAIAVAIDKSEVPKSITKPGFDTCLQDSSGNAKMYLYLPMLTLVTANIVLFLITMYDVWLIKQHFSSFREDKHRNQKHNNLIVLYLKLSIIMGVSWIVEAIQEMIAESLTPWLFYMVNALNALIGVPIFFVLIIKKSVLGKLCQRFGIQNRWTRRSTHMKSTTRTDISRTRNRAIEDSIQFHSTSVNHCETISAADRTEQYNCF